MAVKEIKADVGDVRVFVSGHETSVFLYIVDGVDGAMVESRVLVAVLSRDQASDIAFALLGDRAAASPFIEPEPAYMQDAPPITDEDDDGFTYSAVDLEYAPDHIAQDAFDALAANAIANRVKPRNENTDLVTVIARTFAAGQEAGDQAGFERGYESAVDDFRHGLWADEGISYAHRSYLDEQTTPEPSDYHSYSDIARDGRFE